MNASRMTHTVRKGLLISLAALTTFAAGATAYAASAPETPAGRHGQAATQEQRQAKWAEHAAKRQARLHDALKITPAQEPAWAAYLAAMKPAATARRRGDRAEWAGLTAPARMEKRLSMAKEHIAAMESRLPALNAFYAQLTPEQKKLFDAHGVRGGKGMGGHGHRHGHGPDGNKMPG